MAKKPSHHQPFSEVVERVEREVEVHQRQSIPWPDPIGDGVWTDERGDVWKLRGGEATEKRAEHLLRDPSVRVRHLYGLYEQRDVPPEEREAYWARIVPYLRGQGEEAVREFSVGEFKNSAGTHMLIIQESC